MTMKNSDLDSPLGSDVEEITKEEAEAFSEDEDVVNVSKPPSPSSEKEVATTKTETKQSSEPTAPKEKEASTTTTTEDAKPQSVLPKKAEAEAIQIVSIGTKDDEYAFKYHEDSFKQILQKIPDPINTKISVVSVVGAFRTGKSFLLSWFLRYLDYHFGSGAISTNDDTTTSNVPALEEEGEKKTSSSSKKKWYDAFETLGHESGFDWRGGKERNTTGIWMWSEPFLVTNPSTKKKFALLLVDTQGMFDHETTVSLTAAIFGLSTLLSSYQIYNVDKRIQEDHLQQLALFSEYGRTALKVEQEESKKAQLIEEEEAALIHANATKTETKTPSSSSSKEVDIELTPVGQSEAKNTTSTAATTATKPKKKETPTAPQKPFQKIEFLVRDWQNFDDDEMTDENEDTIIQEMEDYLKGVLEERDAKDLKDTREQIATCFDKISCFLFPHPGFAVTKKKYGGEVKDIEPFFLQLLDRYCHRVFDIDTLEAKKIHGRELTAAELEAFMKAYAGLFTEGAHFPETGTMLEATATANNSNAIALSIASYRTEMDHLAGTNVTSYVKPAEFEEQHLRLLQRSLSVFDDIAAFGSIRSIQSARERVLNEIDGSFRMYQQLNESRNPFMGIGLYLVAISVALVALILRLIADTTCSSWSQTCRYSSDMLAELFAIMVIFLLIIIATKFKLIKERFKQAKALVA